MQWEAGEDFTAFFSRVSEEVTSKGKNLALAVCLSDDGRVREVARTLDGADLIKVLRELLEGYATRYLGYPVHFVCVKSDPRPSAEPPDPEDALN